MPVHASETVGWPCWPPTSAGVGPEVNLGLRMSLAGTSMSRSGGSPYHVTYRMMHVITIRSLRSVYIIPSRIFTVRNKVVKVMFLHLSVILSMGGGVCLSACWDTTPTPRPGLPWSTHPPTPSPSREPTATFADGTHPTGMHSCYTISVLTQLTQNWVFPTVSYRTLQGPQPHVQLAPFCSSQNTQCLEAAMEPDDTSKQWWIERSEHQLLFQLRVR